MKPEIFVLLSKGYSNQQIEKITGYKYASIAWYSRKWNVGSELAQKMISKVVV